MLLGWFRRRAIAAASASDGVATRRSPGVIAPFNLPALSTATREYARTVEAGTLDRLGDRDLMRLRLAMGPEIWAWQYALRLTGQAPWRAAPSIGEHFERVRADRQMAADIVTWERALVELDGEMARARLYGRPRPEPLMVPAALLSAIEARRAAALERAVRKRGRAGDDSAAPAFSPDGVVPHPSRP